MDDAQLSTAKACLVQSPAERPNRASDPSTPTTIVATEPSCHGDKRIRHECGGDGEVDQNREKVPDDVERAGAESGVTSESR